eukprot:COSAG06_NODE_2509_length_6742_cov_3.061418_1_plen_128_part_10
MNGTALQATIVGRSAPLAKRASGVTTVTTGHSQQKRETCFKSLQGHGREDCWRATARPSSSTARAAHAADKNLRVWEPLGENGTLVPTTSVLKVTESDETTVKLESDAESITRLQDMCWAVRERGAVR